MTPDKVKEFISEQKLLEGVRGIICAYSGGADSSVMLRLLCDICKERGISLRAVHVNHSIRGAEADRDENFCRKSCEELNVEFQSVRVDAPAYAKEKKVGIEEAARKLRYAAFEGLRLPDEVIATAHNATDNGETVIYNLIRGAGLKGLSGIPPKRDSIIRPILCLTREEVREYADVMGIEYIYDSTNDDLCHPRNLIRAKIIPVAKEINPTFETTVLNLSDILRCEEECVSEISESVEICRSNGKISVSLSEFSALSEPVMYRVLRKMFLESGGYRLSSVNVSDVLSLCGRAVGGSSVNLPNGVTAEIFRGRLILSKNEAPKNGFSLPDRVGVEKGKITAFGEYELFLASDGEELKKVLNVYKLLIFDKINFDTINGSLFVRTRQSGDSYRSRSVTKALRRRMSEIGIPKDARDSYPVVCDSSGVVWLPGDGVADRCFTSQKDKITYICCGKK